MSKSVPTQNFIEINSIKQDTLILRNGGLRKALLVSGVNFDLLSEEEQGLVIYSFQAFLNSLNFPLQIFIHSRKINIDNYLSKLSVRYQEEPIDLLKNIIKGYQEFIHSFVGQNAIMEKSFFVVIPYDPIKLPSVGRLVFKKIIGLIKRKPITQTEISTVAQKDFENYLKQLNRRVDQTIEGLSQIGLRAVSLNEQELIEVFYNLYNPEAVERKT